MLLTGNSKLAASRNGAGSLASAIDGAKRRPVRYGKPTKWERAKPNPLVAEARALRSLQEMSGEKRHILKNAASIVAKFRDGKNLK